MSYTTTIDPTKTTSFTQDSLFVHLVLKPRDFLESMSKNILFTEQQRQLILALLENFEDEKAPQFLTLFLSDIVKPSIDSHEDIASLEQLMHIDEQVKRILSSILPKDTNIDSYIKKTTLQGDQDLAFKRASQSSRDLFQKLVAQLYEMADQILQNNDTSFEKLKERQIKILQIKEILSQKFLSQHQSQVERINLLSDELFAITLQVQQQGASHQQIMETHKLRLRKYYELLDSCK
jgi:hypothetical protein